MKSVHDVEVSGKRVLMRVDFNVPMNENGEVSDDLRIQTALPTLEYLLEQKAKIILCTHLGRPKGKRVEAFSLAPVAQYLSELLHIPVPLAPDCIGAKVEAQVAAMQDGDVLMLENLRFYAKETSNDPGFSAQLANLADVYINNAFAVSHRAHASVVGVPSLMEHKAAGLLLEKELSLFQRSVENPTRPLVAIVGGAKVSGKLEALESMLDRVDTMLIGGAMANTFLKSHGLDVGASLVEDDLLENARSLMKKAAERGVKIHLPVDVIAADSFSADATTKQVTVQDIPAGWMALDIGPATVICFQEVLADARTIVWNGPMGAFEMDAFARGTMALAHIVGDSHAFSITGGGDSNAAVRKAGAADAISYMSTGGGAFLMLMEGKDLPGAVALG